MNQTELSQFSLHTRSSAQSDSQNCPSCNVNAKGSLCEKCQTKQQAEGYF